MSNLNVIVGLGITGLSCARYLAARDIPFAVIDTRTSPPNLDVFHKEFPDRQVVLGHLDTDLLNKAQRIILSPGVALQTPEMMQQAKQGKLIIGDVELFAQAVTVPVIAITGTNAKSTVTTLVGKMAEACGYHPQVGGNLGIPVLDLLGDANTNLFVLELSSFQLETTFSLQAEVATVLNITPDHMDRYVDFAAYIAAKKRIYRGCKVAVCNRDDELTEYNDAERRINFTLGHAQQNEFGLLRHQNETYLAYQDQPLIAVKELPVVGKHYQANALAALAIGYGFGFEFSPMLEVLREFKGLAHRCQFVRELNGVKWYNDSKGTNVGATKAAIEGLGSEITSKMILIAGGVGKNADFSSLVPTVEKYVKQVILIGEAAQELAMILDGRTDVSFAATLDEAVTQAAAIAKRNDYVLLSPACASFDMFRNFEHRGEVFMKIVEEL